MRKFFIYFNIAFAVFFFASTPQVFALSYSPSTIYYGTSYTLTQSVSNNTGSNISVTKDCFYWKNGVYGGTWGNGTATIPPGGGTVSCSSTGDVAGSQMSFQMNVWFPNYSGTYSDTYTSFTVQPTPTPTPPPKTTPTITWADFTMTYGGSITPATANVAGTFSYSTASYDAGTRNITATFTPTDTTLYNSATKTVSMTINKKTLTITADNKTKVQGTANPTLTASYSGFTNGDTSVSGSPSLSTTAVTGSAVGDYTITVTAGTLSSSNYSFSFTNGTLTVTAPPTFTLNVSTSGSGSITGTGINCGSDCTETYTSGTSVTLTASPSSGYDFSSWSGCSSTNGTSCTVSMTSAKSVTATFTQQTFNYSLSNNGNISVTAGTSGSNLITVTRTAGLTQPVTVSASGLPTGATATFATNGVNPTSNISLSVSTTGNTPVGTHTITITGTSANTPNKTTTFSLVVSAPAVPNLSISKVNEAGTKMNGGQNFIENKDYTYVARVANTGGADADNVIITLYKGSSSSNVTTQIASTISGGNISIGAGSSKNIALTSYDFPAGTWWVKSCVLYDPPEICSSPSSVIFSPIPSPPGSACSAIINNHITGSSDWTNTANVQIIGCPSPEYQNMSVSGSAGVNSWLADSVFDVNSLDWRGFNATNYSADRSAETKVMDSEKSCYQDTCKYGFGFDLAVAMGMISTKVYTTPFTLATTYKKSSLPRGGKFGYFTENFFNGDYLCYTENISTYNSTTNTVSTTNYPYLEHFTASTELMACIESSGSGSGENYYKTACTPINNSVGLSAKANCPNGTVTVPVSITSDAPAPGPSPFIHTLHVNGLLDGKNPGVPITQVSVSSPGSNFPLNYFAGTTDYTRVAERNLTVVLEAPANLTSTIADFTGWSSECAVNPNNTRQCTVSFAFTASGGVTKTVTANYSSSLPTPTITIAEAGVCGGKVRLTWNPVADAVGYRVYRASTLNGTYTEITGPDPSAGYVYSGSPVDYTDISALTPGNTYYYQVSAYAGTRRSASSGVRSSPASILCPDLVVDSVTPTNSGGTSVTQIIAGDSIRFSAVVRNQGGATPTTFQNQFTLDNSSATFPTKISLNGLGTGISNTVTTLLTEQWVAIAGSHTIQVCADYPLTSTGWGSVFEESSTNNAETNNCLTTPFSFTVLPKLSATLEAGKADNTSYGSSVIINYEDASNLRWTVSGNPTTCNATPNTDWTGSKVTQSYTVSGNPLLAPISVPTKLKYIYQLDCSR
ncbi:MAG: hypothetical protein NUV47_01365 [Patescibacteria group bacterium]|nr:hypothetical protein [Patescibacteria group bacterium]